MLTNEHFIRKTISCIKQLELSSLRGHRQFQTARAFVVFMVLIIAHVQTHAHEIRPAVIQLKINPDQHISIKLQRSPQSHSKSAGTNHDNTGGSIIGHLLDHIRKKNTQQLPVHSNHNIDTSHSGLVLQNQSGTEMPLFQPNEGNSRLKPTFNPENLIQSFQTSINSNDEQIVLRWDTSQSDAIVEMYNHTGVLIQSGYLTKEKPSMALTLKSN